MEFGKVGFREERYLNRVPKEPFSPIGMEEVFSVNKYMGYLCS